MTKGIIVKGIGGFYYIQTDLGLLECKARGKFRKDSLIPVVGDWVQVSVQDEEKMLGNIEEILPRKNVFIRPPVANVDQMIIILAVQDPMPDLLLVDKLTVTALSAGVDCIICINKIDLNDKKADELFYIYQIAGFHTILASSKDGVGIAELRDALKDKVSALAGNSGVGKSSILNSIDSSFELQTGSVSDKIKRGKHTTRHTELLHLNFGGYVFDTPGFSTFEVETIRCTELENYFPEIAKHIGNCRFKGCTHINEPDCAVKESLNRGEINAMRYESYKTLYETLKEIKEWMR